MAELDSRNVVEDLWAGTACDDCGHLRGQHLGGYCSGRPVPDDDPLDVTRCGCPEFAAVYELADEAGCSCGWRGAGDDVDDHPCPLPDPQEPLDCCGHPRERHYGEYGDGVPRCEYCDCSVRSW